MFIVCPGCGHSKHFAKLGIANKRFRCSNCDAREAAALRNFKGWLKDLTERERHQARLDTFAGLLWICGHKGYKPGWAAHKFKVLYLVWPRFEVIPQAPFRELLHWVSKQRTRYAADMKKREADGNQCVDTMVDPGQSADGRIGAMVAQASSFPQYQSATMTEDDWSVSL